ncbi:MAG: YitT family protein [Clostridiales bacterium]|nr:YitT family protein [Clostridiales bacterium]
MIKQNLKIIIGIIMVAISLEYFFIPNNIASGGISGLAIIVNYVFPNMNVSIITLIFNVILFIISFVLIGGGFGKNTIYTSIGLSFVMWIIEEYLGPYAITDDIMLATIFGSIISAIGTAIVFNNNSSTGGTDIIAKILNKYFELDLGKGLLIVDCVITLIAVFILGVDEGLYSFLSVIILGISVDRFIDGLNTSKEVIIMSTEIEKISEYILNNLERGCTYLKCEGAYSKKDFKAIYSVMGRNEYIKLKKFILQHDNKAFISVRESYEIFGEGFKKMND